MAELSEEIKAEISERNEKSAAETSSAQGGGDAMWNIDIKDVDNIGDGYDYTYYNKNSDVPHDGHFNYDVSEPTVYNRGVYLNTDTGTEEELRPHFHWTETLPKPQRFTPGPAVTSQPSSLDDLGQVGTGKLYRDYCGTVEDPNKLPRLVPNCLFIGGTTSQADINQGDIGDCFFLSAMLSIIQADPSFIPKMMTVNSNGDVRTNFYHKEGTGEDARWVQKPIQTKYGLMKNAGFKGAFYRIAYDPVSSTWEANFEEDELSVTRTDYYEAALWVNCIEQAYGYYTQLYGKDGTGASERPEGHGLKQVHGGGSSSDCIHIFMGGESEDGQIYMTNTDQSKGIVGSIQPFLIEFMKFAMAQNHDKAECMFMSISAHNGLFDTRAPNYIRNLLNDIDVQLDDEIADHDEIEKAKKDLNELLTEFEEYVPLVKKSNPTSEDKETIADLRETIHEYHVKLYDNTTLLNMNNENFLSLSAILGTIVEQYWDDMFMYTGHAYNLSHVDFKDADNQPIVIDGAIKYDEFIDRVDLDKSEVQIENPHNQSVRIRPNEEGTSRTHDGRYTVSLRELLSAIDKFTSVMGKNTLLNESQAKKAESLKDATFLKGAGGGNGIRSKVFPGNYYNAKNEPVGQILNASEVDDGSGYSYNQMENHEALFGKNSPGRMIGNDNQVKSVEASHASQTGQSLETPVKYVTKTPVVTSAKPAPSKLYEKSDSGIEVSMISGSVNDPNVHADIEKDCLFIDGVPSARDIMQGDIGDSYFMAALLQVVHAQPERILRMMRIDGDEVDTAFFHRLGPYSWEPVHVRTKWGYTQRTNSDGSPAGHGALVRIDTKPTGQALWSASIDDKDGANALCIHKTNYYQAALWVNAMENAYSIFAQKYGKYGNDEKIKKNSFDKNTGKDRYGLISSGNANKCMGLFFERDTEYLNEVDMSKVAKSKDLVKGNEEIYQYLLDLSTSKKIDQDNLDNDESASHNTTMMSVILNTDTGISKLKTAGKQLLKEVKEAKKSNSDYAEVESILSEMNSYVQKTKDLNNVSQRDSNESVMTALTTLNEYCQRLESHAPLLSALPTWLQFRHYAGNIVSMSGNHFIETGQVYNISGVTFRNKDGEVLSDVQNVTDLMAQVDVYQSTVSMENPRGMNPPEDNSPAVYSGRFDVSLADFFLNTECASVSTVRHE